MLSSEKIGIYDLKNLKQQAVPELIAYSRKVAADGCVLLKNNNNVLPFNKGEKISVFGRIQLNYYKSGTGSGGLVNAPYVTNILDGLRANEKVEVNEKLAAVYAEWVKENPFEMGAGWAQEPWCQKEMPLDDETVKTAAAESDKAIIIIGRTAGEDQDNFAGEGGYFLTEAELDMVKKVSSAFDKVAVVLNVGNVIDVKFVDDYNIDALLYVWQGGMEGGNAAADILCGDVNPSGKLADTIVEDITQYPSNANFGDKICNKYAEDIYVGYRYFETVAKDEVKYPFGFGLSYTTFELTTDSVSVNDGDITATVTVKNTGDFDGKEVVQLYYEAPQG
ncbi:MAG: glycoside hydrolase family 3 C-terminal domain-containing protein, partial [Clostridia bacterium]|nr:glycoside hydrolase family 3 C-terminal domain-containing protein [Clostridia bacterium]